MSLPRNCTLTIHVNGWIIPSPPDHPFYVHGKGWTQAADLQVGELLDSDGDDPVPINAIVKRQPARCKRRPAAVGK